MDNIAKALTERMTKTERDQSFPDSVPRDAATMILIDREGPDPKVLLGRRHADFHQAQVARHAQVTDQGAHFGIDQQVFGPALHQHDALPRQAHIQVFWNWPAQAPLTHHHAADALAFQVRGDPAAGGFDFW